MTLRIEDRGAVRWLTLDRPDTRNGLTVDITKAIATALRDLTETTRAIAITGANGAFCSGLDLKDAMRR
ncbi:MAG: enoyl-CoA hydratase/isomerase family protein, partial [Deltaproteobacteria bacterium]|nr:enoyl-CoA hydratase/isomerase family protein [Deltaproteobacteria bacterium]